MSLNIKEFEEEINCLCNLYLADKMKEAKCQKDRVIESFKEALKEKKGRDNKRSNQTIR